MSVRKETVAESYGPPPPATSPDYTGNIIGTWTIEGLAPQRAEPFARWVCKCSCGYTREIMERAVASGRLLKCNACLDAPSPEPPVAKARPVPSRAFDADVQASRAQVAGGGTVIELVRTVKQAPVRSMATYSQLQSEARLLENASRKSARAVSLARIELDDAIDRIEIAKKALAQHQTRMQVEQASLQAILDRRLARWQEKKASATRTLVDEVETCERAQAVLVTRIEELSAQAKRAQAAITLFQGRVRAVTDARAAKPAAPALPVPAPARKVSTRHPAVSGKVSVGVETLARAKALPLPAPPPARAAEAPVADAVEAAVVAEVAAPPAPRRKNVLQGTLEGQPFGRWTAQHLVRRKGGVGLWACKCVCGNEGTISENLLVAGHSRGCRACFFEGVFIHDLEGRKAGDWAVLKSSIKQTDTPSYLCACACGVEEDVPAKSIVEDTTKPCLSCKAIRTQAEREGRPVPPYVKPGKPFGKWTSRAPHAGSRGRQWVCDCECGTTFAVSMHNLRSGSTLACQVCKPSVPAGNDVRIWPDAPSK